MTIIEQDVTRGLLNRFFHFGSPEPLWKVVEIINDMCLCNMIGTNDCAMLPQKKVSLIIEEYEESFDDSESGLFFNQN